MKTNFSTFALVSALLFGSAVAGLHPPVKRVAARETSPSSDVDALVSTVKIHTANISMYLPT